MTASPTTPGLRDPRTLALHADDPALHVTVPLTVRIRRCREEDLPRLEWFGLFTHHRAIIREAFERQRAGDNVMLVGDAGGFPVAQAWIDLARLHAERVGLLWAVRVLPALQGLGLGSRLIGAAETVLRRLGYVAAEIGVEKENPGARRLYERLGYVVVREGREAYAYTTPAGVTERVGLDEWFLRKRLAPVAGAAGHQVKGEPAARAAPRPAARPGGAR
ncbi:MAG TPA: GNAT family N-acetyltransferase [Gemmatimonadaceae bacterium]|nr:GNAT family N-acetyltransferase [Gemmatimonadaceae bacterium]